MKSEITFGEKYGPAMDVQTQEEAAAYFEECVQHTMSHGKDRAEAERIERINIGYWTGYYDNATAARVQQLFGVGHPIFGTTKPTVQEALDAGVKMAKEIERRES